MGLTKANLITYDLPWYHFIWLIFLLLVEKVLDCNYIMEAWLNGRKSDSNLFLSPNLVESSEAGFEEAENVMVSFLVL